MQKKPPKSFIDLISIVLTALILVFLTIFAVNTIKIRSRDAQRVADLNNIKGSIEQKMKLDKSIPLSGYGNLKNALGMLSGQLSQDPINSGASKYYYISKNNSFVLLAKMETSNLSAKTDNGKYNKKPLYYEIGYGPNWQKLIPDNLK